MVRIKSKREDSPYIYKLALECLGRSFEFGVSREELEQLKEKGARYLPRNGKVKNYFTSLRSKFHAKKEAAKERVSKDQTAEERTSARAERKRATASP